MALRERFRALFGIWAVSNQSVFDLESAHIDIAFTGCIRTTLRFRNWASSSLGGADGACCKRLEGELRFAFVVRAHWLA